MNWHETNHSDGTDSFGSPMNSPRDPLWLTSQFSTKELEGQRVWINWVRGGVVESSGVYVMSASSYGHSRHIQNIRAVPEDSLETGDPPFDFDQADADQLRRTNEQPAEFIFSADLDLDRKRQQNLNLEKLVRERRVRKREDEDGGPHLSLLQSS